jgi:hypothetical protein
MNWATMCSKLPLRPLGTSPSKQEGGRNIIRSPNLLGELSEGLRGCLPHAEKENKS